MNDQSGKININLNFELCFTKNLTHTHSGLYKVAPTGLTKLQSPKQRKRVYVVLRIIPDEVVPCAVCSM